VREGLRGFTRRLGYAQRYASGRRRPTGIKYTFFSAATTIQKRKVGEGTAVRWAQRA